MEILHRVGCDSCCLFSKHFVNTGSMAGPEPRMQRQKSRVVQPRSRGNTWALIYLPSPDRAMNVRKEHGCTFLRGGGSWAETIDKNSQAAEGLPHKRSSQVLFLARLVSTKGRQAVTARETLGFGQGPGCYWALGPVLGSSEGCQSAIVLKPSSALLPQCSFDL